MLLFLLFILACVNLGRTIRSCSTSCISRVALAGRLICKHFSHRNSVVIFFLSLHCLCLFDLRLLVSPMISSNVFLQSSWHYFNWKLLKHSNVAVCGEIWKHLSHSNSVFIDQFLMTTVEYWIAERTSYTIQAFRTYFQINKSTVWVPFI
jgi:hypothetical protein